MSSVIKYQNNSKTYNVGNHPFDHFLFPALTDLWASWELRFQTQQKKQVGSFFAVTALFEAESNIEVISFMCKL